MRGGRETQERGDVYIELIHDAMQQKLTRHCKATSLQFKDIIIFETNNKKRKRSIDICI